jgi:hypothetical protein
VLSVNLLPPGGARAWLLYLLRLRVSPAELSRAKNCFRCWGRPALVFAWPPVIGVPLCLVARAIFADTGAISRLALRAVVLPGEQNRTIIFYIETGKILKNKET